MSEGLNWICYKQNWEHKIYRSFPVPTIILRISQFFIANQDIEYSTNNSVMYFILTVYCDISGYQCGTILPFIKFGLKSW